MPALPTHAQVEGTATFFGVLCARFGNLLRAVSTFGAVREKSLMSGVCLHVSQVSDQRWVADPKRAHSCRSRRRSGFASPSMRQGAQMRVSGLKTAQANQK